MFARSAERAEQARADLRGDAQYLAAAVDATTVIAGDAASVVPFGPGHPGQYLDMQP
jgi:hypothetical protein